MAKDPFELMKLIDEINRNYKVILGSYESVQSALTHIDSIVTPDSLRMVSQFEHLIKPRELEFLASTAESIAANQFDTSALKNSLSSFLDVSPLMPEFEIANQLRKNLFDANGNLTPRFAEFSSYVGTIPEENLWYDEETDEISPEAEKAVDIVLPSQHPGKLEIATFILTLIMFAYQIYSDYQLGQFLDKMLEYEERKTVALETLAGNSDDSDINDECDNLASDNREYADDEQHQD